MATSTFLSNATVHITQGATTWDVSDNCSNVTLTVGNEPLESTCCTPYVSGRLPASSNHPEHVNVNEVWIATPCSGLTVHVPLYGMLLTDTDTVATAGVAEAAVTAAS